MVLIVVFGGAKSVMNSSFVGTEGLPSFVRFNNPALLSSDGDSAPFPFDTTQEDPDPLKLGGIRLRDEAKQFAVRLRRLSNEEIGITTMQGIFDSLGYSDSAPDYSAKLTELSRLLGTKLSQYLKVLRTSKITVENLYQLHLRQAIGQRLECCNIPNADLKWDDSYQCQVSQEFSCDLFPSTLLHADTFNPGRNLTEVFQHNVQYIQSIKWQYFLSTDGIHNEFPAHNFPNLLYSDCKNVHDFRHRGVFYSTIYQRSKNIVIVIDQGSSLSAAQLKIAKAIAKHIIYSLNEGDRVAVMSVSSEVRFSRDDSCVLDRLTFHSYEKKLFHVAFIDLIEKESTAMNHSLAFSTAFDLIRRSLLRTDEEEDSLKQDDVLIAYISRGLLSTLAEAKDVLTTIYDENALTSQRVFINTYAVIDEMKSVMYERTFLQDVADQNYTKYLVEREIAVPIRRGKATSVMSTRNLGAILGDIFQPFDWPIDSQPALSLPVKDEVGKGTIVTLTWPCMHDGHLFGIVGIDIHAGDVLEPATYYTQDNSYAIVLNNRGYVMVHPSLDRPILSSIQPMFAHLVHFENIPGLEELQKRMISESVGKETVVIRFPGNSSVSASSIHSNGLQDPSASVSVSYLWQHISLEQSGRTVFIAVLKVFQETSRDLKPSTALNDPLLIYHRLDLIPTENNCMHLKQLATFDTSTFFLSASAFIHPFEHLIQDETKRMVQGYLAFLNDNTNLISNPGILDHIRTDVAATSMINSDWLQQNLRSSLSEYIVRRYVATPSGVFRMFPGTLLSKNYDPTRRHWYLRALENPGKVTLTPPYLDIGGAGYIVTISHTIYEGKPAVLHGPADRIAAVMGMDISFKYFYKMLTDQIPICEQENIRCFIMDDRGYLIAHRGLIEPNDRGPLEEKHITHKEPLVTNDMLNHRGFVTKRACHSFMDRTTQRYYQFNTSLDGILTNLVHGEHCARYQITPIFGTNAFLGIVNQTCDMIRAFCPCSMVDRLCLNCHRMEQTECECPCECALRMNLCSETVVEVNDSQGSCPKFPEETEAVKVSLEVGRILPQCFQPICAQKVTRSDCIGVIDCEWCELEGDGLTRTRQAFCSTQRTCFGGILGARSPYNDHIPYRDHLKDDPVTFKSMPVGPVAGGIMGGFLLLALGIYCHRHRVCQHSRHYTASLPDGQLRDSNNENDFDDLDDLHNGYVNIVLSTFDNSAAAAAANVNPYFMNTSYRRPTNTDSDLGYSSMTPRDDSEQASTTCVESTVMGRDRYRPAVPAVRNPALAILPPPPQTTTQAARKHQRLLVEMDSNKDALPKFGATNMSEFGVTKLLEVGVTVPEFGVMKKAEFGGAVDSMPPQTVIPEEMTLLPHQVLTNVLIHAVDTH